MKKGRFMQISGSPKEIAGGEMEVLAVGQPDTGAYLDILGQDPLRH